MVGTGGTGVHDSMRARLALTGPAMAVLWIAGPLVATSLYPAFDWTANTLAQVGQAGRSSAIVFDASIGLGAVFGLVFLGLVWTTAANRLQRAGLAAVGLLVSLVGVAQLGVQNPWFELIALAFIIGLLPALALSGSGDVLDGHAVRGLTAIWLGIAHLLVWQVVSIILGFSSATPTFVSMVLVSAWVLTHYRDLTEPFSGPLGPSG